MLSNRGLVTLQTTIVDMETELSEVLVECYVEVCTQNSYNVMVCTVPVTYIQKYRKIGLLT